MMNPVIKDKLSMNTGIGEQTADHITLSWTRLEKIVSAAVTLCLCIEIYRLVNSEEALKCPRPTWLNQEPKN